MTTISDTLEDVGSINVFDPNLPSLASEAAIDIDNMIANRLIDYDAMRKLSQMLKNSINDNTSYPNNLRMDFATSSIIGEVVVKTFINDNKIKIDEQIFNKRILEIANILSKDNPLDDIADLEKAMVFCLALSKASLSFRKSLRDLRPQHPFRK
jgi:hypothetical protein